MSLLIAYRPWNMMRNFTSNQEIVGGDGGHKSSTACSATSIDALNAVEEEEGGWLLVVVSVATLDYYEMIERKTDY